MAVRIAAVVVGILLFTAAAVLCLAGRGIGVTPGRAGAPEARPVSAEVVAGRAARLRQAAQEVGVARENRNRLRLARDVR